MSLDRVGNAEFRVVLAAYRHQVGSARLVLPECWVWLRFDDRQFDPDQTITPSRFLPPEWQDLYDRGQLRRDRVYVVAAAGPDQVSPAVWNERRRWCYQVEPELPLELDPDPTHGFMISRMCKTARVVRICRKPQA